MTLSLLSATAALLFLTAAPNEQARAAFERGEKALAAAQYDEAAADYQEALKAAPRYADALNGLGSVYFKQGRRPEAVAQFQAAINADPGFKLAYFNLGYADRKTNDFAGAARAYEKYLQLDPNDADGVFGLAESYRSLGQNAAAVAAYQRYVNMEKRPTEQKWVDKAKEYVATLSLAPSGTAAATAAPTTTTTAQPPSSARATVGDGDRLLAQGHPQEATAVYEQLVRNEPGNVEALFKLGNVLAKQGSYAAAIDRWTQVTQLSREASVRASAQQNIDRARTKLSTPAAAAPVAAAVATPVPSGRRVSLAAYEQGVRSITAQDYASAYASLTQAIQAEPSLSVAYVARGSAQVGLRRYADAALDYQHALSLDPQQASALYGLAESLRAQGKNAEAKSYYERYASSTAPDARQDLQVLARQKASQL